MIFDLGWSVWIIVGLLILLLMSAVIGRKYGEHVMALHPKHKIEVVSIAEGAVFALLGLLIAFTFTGAYDRFEQRKLYIIDEVNAITTASMRIALLPAESQATMRQLTRDYLEARIGLYKNTDNISYLKKQRDILDQMRFRLWDEGVKTSLAVTNPSVANLYLSALNNMFDIASTRYGTMKIHPPVAVFVLLIGLAALSSFLAGYAMAGSRIRYSVHLLGYIFICALTIYVIIDLELPRQGLINVNSFDNLLMELQGEVR